MNNARSTTASKQTKNRQPVTRLHVADTERGLSFHVALDTIANIELCNLFLPARETLDDTLLRFNGGSSDLLRYMLSLLRRVDPVAIEFKWAFRNPLVTIT